MVYDCFDEGKVQELVDGDEEALGNLDQVENHETFHEEGRRDHRSHGTSHFLYHMVLTLEQV
ncbi:hypothetical protein AMTR_s00022p00194640 [Amborella trichopoda]|uniref:Uncharacterized protein n=1 Tax=Amborella trichopoda TaxID=13333 RepID=W1PV86_AMBTC|nr:hypothetical protein AMTR_s00022p00194640 [Amborella trichopoda]